MVGVMLLRCAIWLVFLLGLGMGPLSPEALADFAGWTAVVGWTARLKKGVSAAPSTGG